MFQIFLFDIIWNKITTNKRKQGIRSALSWSMKEKRNNSNDLAPHADKVTGWEMITNQNSKIFSSREEDPTGSPNASSILRTHTCSAVWSWRFVVFTTRLASDMFCKLQCTGCGMNWSEQLTLSRGWRTESSALLQCLHMDDRLQKEHTSMVVVSSTRHHKWTNAKPKKLSIFCQKCLDSRIVAQA